MKTIGKKIKELRLNNEVSQEELAFQLGVSRQAISKWESDAVQPSTDSIMAICDYFNVPSDYLLGNGEIERNEPIEKNIVATKSNEDNFMAKKKKLLFIGLLVLVSILFILGVCMTCLSLSVSNQPSLGYDEVDSWGVDNALIVIGIALAVVSLALFIFFAVLLFKNNKRK